jgi:heme iron utilization protein
MAMHTQNLKTDRRCSLFLGQAVADGDPLGAARATLIDHAEPVPEHDAASVREQYLARHENSRYWVDFTDFSFFRLQSIDLYYVAGFGVMDGSRLETTNMLHQTRCPKLLPASSLT